jgi:SAM-dependent methyltransferase
LSREWGVPRPRLARRSAVGGEFDRACEVMRDFWDRKARENATYYISAYRDYADQDMDEFWKWGEILTDRYLEASGIHFTGEEVVLDLGCGIGRMTRALAARFAVVYGLDVSGEMIARARENLKECANVRFEVGSGVDLSNFEGGMFDFVFSYITFQHIPYVTITQRYICEMGRVLKEGKHAYFQINNARLGLRILRARLKLGSRLTSAAGRLCDLRGPHDRTEQSPRRAAPTDVDNPAWRGCRISVGQVRGACEEGSLDIIDMRGAGSKSLWVTARKRLVARV